MGRYFGTDGIRGPADGPFFECAFLRKTAAGLARYLLSRASGKPVHAVIGCDTRSSGPRIVDIIASELSQYGLHVFNAGVAPTPAVAKAVIDLECDLGIVITASHNPATDNGIKLFARGGRKFSEEAETDIEACIDDQGPLRKVAQAQAFPYDAVSYYLPFVRSLIHMGDLTGWRIVVDTAHGATTQTTPRVLSELGAEVYHLGDRPDGLNINAGVGSEYPEQLGAKVREVGARLGLAHDGDGDRLVVVDEKGGVVEGDALLGILAVFYLQQGMLPEKTMVTTVMSNLGLDDAVEKAGGRVVRSAVGDRNVAQALEVGNYAMGGESSGHLIFRHILPTGDGLVAATQLLRVMLMTGRPLSVLASAIPLYPQKLLNLPVAEKPDFTTLRGFSESVRAIENAIPGRGRILVRYSGTEPKLRLLAEAPTQAALQSAMTSLEQLVRQHLPVR